MISPALARGMTGQPSPMPFTSPKGMRMAFEPENPTTSAVMVRPPAMRISQDVPTATWGKTASTTMPDARVTLPASTQDCASASERLKAARLTRLIRHSPRRRRRARGAAV